MASTILIDFLGTEDFFDRWSGDAEAKIASVKDWCESAWSQVEDGSGDYEASFYAWGDTVQVPSKVLPDGDEAFSERVWEADQWLQDNWYYYESSDAVVLADHYGKGKHDNHGKTKGQAGSNILNVAMYDTYYEDENELFPTYEGVGTEGVAYHELSHLFQAFHSDATTNSSWFSPTEASILYSPAEDPECSVEGSPDAVERFHSACGRSAIRGFIDQEL